MCGCIFNFMKVPPYSLPYIMHKKFYSLSPFNSKQKIIHSASVIWADCALNRLREMSEQVIPCVSVLLIRLCTFANIYVFNFVVNIDHSPLRGYEI